MDNKLKNALDALTKAAYNVLTESNGVTDNEWSTKEGVVVPQWPLDSFCIAITELSNAWAVASNLLHPKDWSNDGKLYTDPDYLIDD